MKLSIDTSAFAKRYIQENGSEALDQLLQKASDLALCVILVPEMISGLNRRLREENLSPVQYRLVKKQLLSDIHDATILQITPAVIARSVQLLEKNTLRAMDALHIACAAEWGADLFVTSDKRQMDAARKSGLISRFIG